MKKIAFMLILILFSLLNADMAPDPSPYDDISNSIWIHGFNDHPGQTFYLVEALWNFERIAKYQPVTVDSMEFQPADKYEYKWFTSNPRLNPAGDANIDYESVEEGKHELKVFDQDKYSLGAPSYTWVLGFSSIQSHYRIVENRDGRRADYVPGVFYSPRRTGATAIVSVDENGKSVVFVPPEEKEAERVSYVPPFIILIDRLVLEHPDFTAVISRENHWLRPGSKSDLLAQFHAFMNTRGDRLYSQEQFNNQDIIDFFLSVSAEIMPKSPRGHRLYDLATRIGRQTASGQRRSILEEARMLSQEQRRDLEEMGVIPPNPSPVRRMMGVIMQPDALWKGFWRAMLFSILIEFFVLLALYPHVTKTYVQSFSAIASLLLWCALGTAFTISALWWFFPMLIENFSGAILVGEIFAVLVEAAIYQEFLKISFTKALLLSFSANLVSFGAGLLM